LHAAVPQRAVVERKAWALTTKPADSEKRLPVISIPATLSLPDLRVEIDLRSEAMSAGDKHWEAEVSARPQGADHEDVDTTKEPSTANTTSPRWGAGRQLGTISAESPRYSKVVSSIDFLKFNLNNADATAKFSEMTA
jgi:hypothetical protein